MKLKPLAVGVKCRSLYITQMRTLLSANNVKRLN